MEPTVGRKVYFFPGEGDKGKLLQKGDEPLDATVVGVHSPSSVNLIIFDFEGNYFAGKEVPFINDREPSVEERQKGGFACWMPYQMGQVQKTEEVLKELKQKNAMFPAEYVPNERGDPLLSEDKTSNQEKK